MDKLMMFLLSCWLFSFASANRCQRTTCSGVGQVCKLKKGVESCQCIKRCNKPISYFCMSNGMIYDSVCHMNSELCKEELDPASITQVPCSDESIPTLPPCPSYVNATAAKSTFRGLTYTAYIHQGKTAVLHCNVKGNPAPVINWMHNHMPLHIDGDKHYKVSGSALYLLNATAEMAGVYACAGVNCYNQVAEVSAGIQAFEVVYIPNFLHTLPVCLDKFWIEDTKCTTNEVAERWKYNHSNGKCEAQDRLICEKGANIFDTEEECEHKCMTFCDAPTVRGPCDHKFITIGYDNVKKVCGLFPYGGCHGSGNHFYDMQECFDVCGRRNRSLAAFDQNPLKPRECPKRCRESLKRAYCTFDFMIRARIIRFGPGVLVVKLIRVFRTSYKFPLYTWSRQNPNRLLAIQLPKEKCACPRLPLAKKKFINGSNDFLISGDFYGKSMVLSNGSYMGLTTKMKAAKLRKFKPTFCHARKQRVHRKKTTSASTTTSS